MSTEEDKEGIASSMLRNPHFRQLLLYRWLWKQCAERWGRGLPIIFTTPRGSTIMEEWTDDKIVEEITLEDLEKELSEDEKESIDELEFGVRGRVASHFWFQEMEQNPHQAQDELEEAGDSPVEVGRQIHEAMARSYGLQRRDDETDEEFRRRVADATIGSGRIRGTPNRFFRGSIGSIFLAHQRNDFCRNCERIGCSRERCTAANHNGECSGYVNLKYPEDPPIACVVCGGRLDSPENFPKGFPDKWKACCYCVEVWSIKNGVPCALVGMEEEEVRGRWFNYAKKMEEAFQL